ncbi:MAG: hypothetical protein REH83_06490, partial [Rickettsiella sp.]|nr:hypothetical protein [Rickettsiella sp.]
MKNSTVLPWILELFKNLAKDYYNIKRNSWDYLITRLHFKNLTSDAEKKNYLIKQLNAILLLHSKHKENPWCIDDRDKSFITIHKKCCLETGKKLSEYIETIVDTEFTERHLKNLGIKNRKKYLYELAMLAHFRIETDIKNKKPVALIHLSHEKTVDKFKKLLYRTNKTHIQQELKKFNALKKKVTESKYLLVRYSTETESVHIYSSNPSRWEKIEKFTEKNILLHLFSISWNAVSSHANLLKWISFSLILFSLSLTNFPLIILFVAASAISYLILQFIFLFKNNTVVNFFSLLDIKEEEKLLRLIKQHIFNQENFKYEFDLIKEQILNSTTNIAVVYEHLIELQKTNISPQFFNNLQLNNSSIYKHVNQVYFEIQFISSLIINFTSVVLYGYLVSWAVSVFFNAIGAAILASFIASPLGVSILIFIPITFYLLHHLINSLSSENHYRTKIFSLLNATCNYVCIDAN